MRWGHRRRGGSGSVHLLRSDQLPPSRRVCCPLAKQRRFSGTLPVHIHEYALCCCRYSFADMALFPPCVAAHESPSHSPKPHCLQVYGCLCQQKSCFYYMFNYISLDLFPDHHCYSITHPATSPASRSFSSKARTAWLGRTRAAVRGSPVTGLVPCSASQRSSAARSYE